ncbi:gag-pre-integrase domain-containing protein [Tanacetum coccineum]
MKTFDDVSRHLELKEDRQEPEQNDTEAYVAESSGQKKFNFKRTKGKCKGKHGKLGPNKANFVTRNKGKRGHKKEKSKMECYKCGKWVIHRAEELFLGITYYGTRNNMDGFMVLDTVNNKFNVNSNCFSYVALSSSNVFDDSITWHARLRHIGKDRMNRLAQEGLLGPLSIVSFPTCELCLAGKATRKQFHKATRATFPL